MDNPIDYRGQVVFVAGGTSGINLGIAHGFARAGAMVAVLSRKQDKVDAAVDELRAHGGEVIGFAADVREYEAVAAALQATRERFAPIDVLISGAAGNFPAPALGMSANAFRSVIEIDLIGSFHVLRAAYEHLNKPGARIINISAPQAWVPMAMQSHVCAAKAGVDMLTRTLAMEWGAAGVRVNSLSPGPIEGTEGMKRLAPDEAARQICADSVPMKRNGTVAEMANAALLVCSPLATYLTGAVIPVDGGWSLNGTGIAMNELWKARG